MTAFPNPIKSANLQNGGHWGWRTQWTMRLLAMASNNQVMSGLCLSSMLPLMDDDLWEGTQREKVSKVAMGKGRAAIAYLN